MRNPPMVWNGIVMDMPPDDDTVGIMPEWQPIETAPRGEYVLLVYPPDGVGHLIAKYGVGVVTVGIGICDWPWTMRPTHWMPLPAPPTSTR